MTDPRDPLHDGDAERTVLGAMMVDINIVPTVTKVLGETSEAFFVTAHQMIYESILNVYHETQTTDPVLVANKLKAKGQLERIGDSIELYDLIERIVETANTEFHAKLVKDKHIRRRLLLSGKKIQDAAQDIDTDLTDVIDTSQSEVMKYTKLNTEEGFREVGPLVLDATKELEELALSGRKTMGLATGFADLDILTNGLHKGELAIIAGRPSMGKSMFALNLMLNVGLEEGENDVVAMFSLEMPLRVMALRLLSSESNVSFSRLRTGDVKETEWQSIANASSALFGSSSRMLLHFDASMSIGALRREARHLKSKFDNLSLIIVDYLQQVRHDRAHYSNREQEVAEVSRELKAMAGELDVAVVAAAQLNRELEKRPDKRPRLADLRESGEIEQAADLVAFLHRDDYYDEGNVQDVVPAELLIRKQRNGATGTINLRLYKEIMRFTDMEA